MSTKKELRMKRNDLVNELLEVCYDLEDMERYVSGNPTSKIINLLRDLDLKPQDDEILIETAENFIKEWGLDHGNNEVFMHDDELFFVIEAPNDWAIGTTIKNPDASMLKHQLIEEILKHLDDIDVDDGFDEWYQGVPFRASEFLEMLQSDYNWYQEKANELREMQ